MTSLLACSNCNELKEEARYSKSQLKKLDNRKCRACVCRAINRRINSQIHSNNSTKALPTMISKKENTASKPLKKRHPVDPTILDKKLKSIAGFDDISCILMYGYCRKYSKRIKKIIPNIIVHIIIAFYPYSWNIQHSDIERGLKLKLFSITHEDIGWYFDKTLCAFGEEIVTFPQIKKWNVKLCRFSEQAANTHGRRFGIGVIESDKIRRDLKDFTLHSNIGVLCLNIGWSSNYRKSPSLRRFRNKWGGDYNEFYFGDVKSLICKEGDIITVEANMKEGIVSWYNNDVKLDFDYPSKEDIAQQEAVTLIKDRSYCLVIVSYCPGNKFKLCPSK